MAVYIVNFQNFKSLINETILKEVAIVSLHSNIQYHWLIRAPTRYVDLCWDLKKRVDYITDNIHGIRWDSGYMEQKYVLEKLKEILKDAIYIYIKGSERVQYIRHLMREYPHIKIRDLDYWIGSDNNKIPNFKCPYSTHKHNSRRCALELATRHKKFYVVNSKVSTINHELRGTVSNFHNQYRLSDRESISQRY